jgi:S-adenosylmethionine/arginine decarboxylase-like enzyme
MTQQHKHLIVRADISWCPQEEDLNKISDWIRSLIKKIDMKLLAGPYTTYVNEKDNKGMTSVAIIETSHIALHIWDEVNPGLMQLDVYSCADFNRPEELKFLTELYPNNVNLIGYNCKKGHLTHAKDCKSSETEILILNYVNDQINSKN